MRSSFLPTHPSGLIDAKNPVATEKDGVQGGILPEAAHEVHVLDGSGSPLDEVVDGGKDDDPVRPRIHGEPHMTAVGPLHGRHIGVEPLAQDPDEALALVEVSI
jgi:hypothetical protein